MIKYLLILLLFIACVAPPQPNLEISSLTRSYEPSEWKQFSLRDKIAQMIMVRVRGNYYYNEHGYRKSLEKWLKVDGIGGVITFGGSIHGTYYNIQQFQKWAKYPLLVAADYERGLGQWMNGATLFPSNMALAATGNFEYAYEQGHITALEAMALGIHVTFSPVMDINNNPNNPIINFRSYSDNPETVAKFGTAFIKGAQDNGLITCAKHFPGHGNTETDSHTSLPTIHGSQEELESLELYPFKKAIQSGVKMIMVGHISVPGLDDRGVPVSHSSIVTSELLREEMRFNGVIITDGMEMGGLAQTAWPGESAVRAVEAGVDILLLPMDVEHSISSIEKAVLSGRISVERINQSVARIWAMKKEAGLLIPPHQIPFSDLEATIGIPQHTQKASEIAEKSITIAKDEHELLPLKPEIIDSLAHIILSLDDDARGYIKSFSMDIDRTHGHVKEIFVNDPLSDLGRENILRQMDKIDQIVISLVVRIRMDKGIATIDSTHLELLKDLQKSHIPIVTFSFGSPYLQKYDMLETYVCAFGYGNVSVKAAANALWGRREVNGKLPIDLDFTLLRGIGVKKKKKSNRWGIMDNREFPDAWAVVDSAMENRIFPGAQVVIVKKGKMIYNGGFGYQTYDSNSPPITEKTIYDIASLTKAVVTVPIIMKLISQKKISLDQSLQQFYPQFNGKWKENVTIRNLMTHSSGLKGYYPFYKNENVHNRDDILESILNSKLEFEPGSKAEYSDLGFILLSSIIEKVSRRPLDSIAESWIFQPLRMKNTKYNPPKASMGIIAPTELDAEYRHRLLHGEVHDENTYLMGGVSGHAGVFSTAEDIAKFAQMLVDGGLYQGKRFFTESQIKEFTTVQNLPEGSDFALGWDTPSKRGKSIAGDYFTSGSFGHLGFTGTSIWIDPNQEIIIVLLTNRVHPSRKEGEGSKEMYGIRRMFYNKVMTQLLSEVDSD